MSITARTMQATNLLPKLVVQFASVTMPPGLYHVRTIRSRRLALCPLSSMISRNRAVNLSIARFMATSTSKSSNPSNLNQNSSNVSFSDAAKYDVCIVGGGMVGLAAAAALKSDRRCSDLRVALIDTQPLNQIRNWRNDENRPISNRTCSLTLKSVAFLKEIGAWDRLDHSRVNGYTDMLVWDWHGTKPVRFSAANMNTMNGYMIENIHLQNTLLDILEETDTALLFGNRVEFIEPSFSEDQGQWKRIQTSGGNEISTRLLIGADGINSIVRQYAKISASGWDYDRQCMVGTLQLAQPSQPSCAFQRFLGAGPIAILPFGGTRASIAFHTTPEIIQMLKSLNSKQFCSMINAALRLEAVDLQYIFKLTDPQEIEQECSWRLDCYNKKLLSTSGQNVLSDELPWIVDALMPTLAPFPLRLRHVNQYYSNRLALIGDAAHLIHPLGGQGLNLGLGDAQSIAAIIVQAHLLGQDVGSPIVLQKYPSERLFKNYQMLSACDKLHKIYGNQNSIITAARSFGVRAIDTIPFAKKLLMKQVSGLE